MTTLKRVALYARFSSDNQRAESIDAQIRAMKKYCQENHYLIVETYVDEAKSATSDKRPAFQQMIKDSDKKLFDVLLVHKLDRFSRNRYDSAMYKNRLKRNGVTVFSVLEKLNDSPESVIMESLLEGMSEYYSKNLSREVMKGLNENALKCKHTGGKPPLGYSLAPDKTLVINENEAVIVRMIFDLYDKGFQYTYIMKKLEQEGYRTRNGNIFSKNSLYTIMHNEKYNGVYVYNRLASKDSSGKRNGHKYKDSSEIVRVEGGCPAIVPKEMFQRVQKRLSMNLHRVECRVTKEYYLLSSKVVCGVCGRHMSGSSRRSGNKKYYLSTYRCAQLRTVCGNREINHLYLDDFIDNYMKEHFFTLENLTKIQADYAEKVKQLSGSTTKKLEQFQHELTAVNEKLKNLMQLVEKGLLNEALYQKIEKLNSEKIRLETCMNEIPKKVSDAIEWTPEGVMKEYNNAMYGSEEYRLLLQRFISEIRVSKFDVKLILKAGENYDSGLSLEMEVDFTRKMIYEHYGSHVRGA